MCDLEGFREHLPGAEQPSDVTLSTSERMHFPDLARPDYTALPMFLNNNLVKL